MTRTPILTLACLALLTACGGVTTTNGGPIFTPVPQFPDTYASRNADRQALLNDTANLNQTSPAALPFSGALSYKGALNANLASRTDVIGDVDLIVDLGRDEIRGTATNFIDRQNRAVRGGLEVFNGRFDSFAFSNQYQAVAGLRGTLVDAFGRNYAISSQLQGDVLGRDAQAFEAVIGGAVKVDGGPQEGVKGGIIATRQNQ